MSEPKQVYSENGTGDNPDNYHPVNFSKWRELTRAALIQQRNALQEQVRALGMQIAALERIDAGKEK